MLMVNEAHATGVLGPTGAGALEHFGLEGRVPVVMGTLSKALGAQGGYVAGDRDLCDYLRTRDRGFVFTTALAPAAAGAALAALDVVRDQPERRARLRALVARLVEGARGLGYTVLPTDSAVVGVLIGEAADALAVGASLRRARVWAPAIRPPSVPAGHRPHAPDGDGHPRGPPHRLGARGARRRAQPGPRLMLDEPRHLRDGHRHRRRQDRRDGGDRARGAGAGARASPC